MPFLNLPRDVIDEILYLLPASNLLTCLLVNKYLNELLKTSLRLAFRCDLARFRLYSNPFCSFSTSERLDLLDESLESWFDVSPKFEYQIDFPHRTDRFSIFEGVVFAEHRNGTLISYMPFARTEDDLNHPTPGWRFIDLHMYGQLVTFRLSLYEHDLLAIVYSTPDPPAAINAPPQFTIAIQLRQFSTQSPHPQAPIDTIFVMKSPIPRPCGLVDIVGRHLVLVLGDHHLPNPSPAPNYVHVYNWQTNTLLMRFTLPHPVQNSDLHQSFIFLDEHHILFPDGSKSYPPRLNIFQIPEEPATTQPVPIVALCLPTLQGIVDFYDRIDVQCNLNPISDDSWLDMHRRYASSRTLSRDDNIHMELSGVDPFQSHRAFLKRGEDAVCVFLLSTAGSVTHEVVTPSENFTMVVHRKTLLSAMKQYQLTPVPRRRSEFPWTTFEDSHNAHVRPTPQIAHNLDPSPSISVAWTQWAHPTLTRWFKDTSEVPRHRIPPVGEKYVRFSPMLRGPPPIHVPYEILDFNKYTYSRTETVCTEKWEQEYLGWMPPPLNAVEPETEEAAESGSVDDADSSDEDEDDIASPREADSHTDLTPSLEDATLKIMAANMMETTDIIPEEIKQMLDVIVAVQPPPRDNRQSVSPASNNNRLSSASDSASEARINPALIHSTQFPELEVSIRLTPRQWRAKMEATTLMNTSAFSPPINCELPFVSGTSEAIMGVVDWDAVWLDEERVIGIQWGEDIKTLHVHHYG